MRKQQDAPGELELVRAFVNSADIEQGEERLGSAEALAEWLQQHGLADRSVRPTRADYLRALELREALRAILLGHNGDSETPSSAFEVLDQAARRAQLRLRFTNDGSTQLEPQAGAVDGALGRLLAIVHASIAQDTWSRLKACREHTCEWAFYDHTKNRSGTWCNMQVCGNRAKARAYRERRATPGV